MKNRSLFSPSLRARIFCGLLIAVATASLTSCHSAAYYYYKFPEYTFANRPIPPSKIANRVMVSVTTNGSSGSLQILDALRDIRNNVEDTIKSFSISGYSAGYPNLILSFPAEIHGYVYSDSDGSVAIINYGTEANSGSAGTFPAKSTSLAVPPGFNHIYSAEETAGILGIIDNTTGKSYSLNLPNVFKVAVNQGDTVVLAMVRNSNAVYRLLKLNINQFPTAALAIPALGAVDCQPLNLPVYCLVPVPGSSTSQSFDRPGGAYFSLDGTTAYILNCGPECGGTTASVTLLQQGSLTIDINTLPFPSSYLTNVPIPGGVTVALASGTTLYLAGQQLQPDGLFAGRLTLLNMATLVPSAPISISDGNHSRLLFADDNTLWIGSQYCATGERAKLGQNYNCLTRFDLGTQTATVIPNVTPGGSTTVAYPNTNQNLYYYGDLTGICWVQNLHKVYTAYGGQVHIFNTADGSEIDNSNVTVQGTALDVAYMDAITDADN